MEVDIEDDNLMNFALQNVEVSLLDGDASNNAVTLSSNKENELGQSSHPGKIKQGGKSQVCSKSTTSENRSSRRKSSKSSTPRRRRFSGSQKMEVLRFLDTHSLNATSRHYMIDVKTVRNWRSNKFAIERKAEEEVRSGCTLTPLAVDGNATVSTSSTNSASLGGPVVPDPDVPLDLTQKCDPVPEKAPRTVKFLPVSENGRLVVSDKSSCSAPSPTANLNATSAFSRVQEKIRDMTADNEKNPNTTQPEPLSSFSVFHHAFNMHSFSGMDLGTLTSIVATHIVPTLLKGGGGGSEPVSLPLGPTTRFNQSGQSPSQLPPPPPLHPAPTSTNLCTQQKSATPPSLQRHQNPLNENKKTEGENPAPTMKMMEKSQEEVELSVNVNPASIVGLSDQYTAQDAWDSFEALQCWLASHNVTDEELLCHVAVLEAFIFTLYLSEPPLSS